MAAAVDNVRFGRIPVAAKIDGIVELVPPIWFDVTIVPFAVRDADPVTGTIPYCVLSSVLLRTFTPAEP